MIKCKLCSTNSLEGYCHSCVGVAIKGAKKLKAKVKTLEAEMRKRAENSNKIHDAMAKENIELRKDRDKMAAWLEAEGHDCEFHTNPEAGKCDWCEMMGHWKAEQDSAVYTAWWQEVARILNNLGFDMNEITDNEELRCWFDDNLRPEEAVSEMFRAN